MITTNCDIALADPAVYPALCKGMHLSAIYDPERLIVTKMPWHALISWNAELLWPRKIFIEVSNMKDKNPLFVLKEEVVLVNLSQRLDWNGVLIQPGRKSNILTAKTAFPNIARTYCGERKNATAPHRCLFINSSRWEQSLERKRGERFKMQNWW